MSTIGIASFRYNEILNNDNFHDIRKYYLVPCSGIVFSDSPRKHFYGILYTVFYF